MCKMACDFEKRLERLLCSISCTFRITRHLVFRVSHKPRSDYGFAYSPGLQQRRLRARFVGFISFGTPGDMSMMTQILDPIETDKQNEAYNYIKREVSCGYAPSIADICECIGEKSRDAVVCYLQALEDEGLITPGSFLDRVIRPFGVAMRIRMVILTDPENGIQYMAVKHLN